MDYKGFKIESKRDFGGKGYLINGKWVREGFVAVKDFCNPMPGATWFQTEAEAMNAIDIYIEVEGDAAKFWERIRAPKTINTEAILAELAEIRATVDQVVQNAIATQIRMEALARKLGKQTAMEWLREEGVEMFPKQEVV